jgi:Flp pilus assembly protein TadG
MKRGRSSSERQENPMMRRKERGAETLEMALCLLPFIGLNCLIVSISWAVFTKSTLQHAVAEGVRYAITSQTMTGMGQDASIKEVVRQNSMGFVNNENLNKVTIQYYQVNPTTGDLTPTLSNLGGNIVEVSVVDFSYGPLAPILKWVGKPESSHPVGTFSVRASDKMEGSPGGIPPTR